MLEARSVLAFPTITSSLWTIQPQGLFLDTCAVLIHACLNALVGGEETDKYRYTDLLRVGTGEEEPLK